MLIRKTEEKTRERAGRELMSVGSGSVRKTEATKNTNVGVVWVTQKHRKVGVMLGLALVGRILRRYVAVWRASAQYWGGMED